MNTELSRLLDKSCVIREAAHPIEFLPGTGWSCQFQFENNRTCNCVWIADAGFGAQLMRGHRGLKLHRVEVYDSEVSYDWL